MRVPKGHYRDKGDEQGIAGGGYSFGSGRDYFEKLPNDGLRFFGSPEGQALSVKGISRTIG